MGRIKGSKNKVQREYKPDPYKRRRKTTAKARQAFYEEIIKIHPEIKEGIMATIILNNDILKLAPAQIIRYERLLDGSGKKDITQIAAGDQIFDLMTGAWDPVLDICVYELLRGIQSLGSYDRRVIKWLHVFGALFAPAAAMRRFANVDGKFFIRSTARDGGETGAKIA